VAVFLEHCVNYAHYVGLLYWCKKQANVNGALYVMRRDRAKLRVKYEFATFLHLFYTVPKQDTRLL